MPQQNTTPIYFRSHINSIVRSGYNCRHCMKIVPAKAIIFDEGEYCPDKIKYIFDMLREQLPPKPSH